MSDWLRIAAHSAAAAAFFFALQRFVNGADYQTSIIWSAAAAVGAAWLAYSQSRRGR